MLMSLVASFREKCNSESLKNQVASVEGISMKPYTLESISKIFQEYKALCSLPGMLASEF